MTFELTSIDVGEGDTITPEFSAAIAIGSMLLGLADEHGMPTTVSNHFRRLLAKYTDEKNSTRVLFTVMLLLAELVQRNIARRELASSAMALGSMLAATCVVDDTEFVAEFKKLETEKKEAKDAT